MCRLLLRRSRHFACTITALNFMSLSMRWVSFEPLRHMHGSPGPGGHPYRYTHHVAVVRKEVVPDEASCCRELAEGQSSTK